MTVVFRNPVAVLTFKIMNFTTPGVGNKGVQMWVSTLTEENLKSQNSLGLPMGGP